MNSSPAEVQKSLSGIEYPSNKGDIISTAKQHNAPPDVLQELNRIPEQEYGGPQDVMKAIGEDDKEDTDDEV